MPTSLPQVTRVYKNHHLDSTRWRVFEPRPDDIIVTTSYKSGTTWMQQILYLLVFRGVADPLPLPFVSPWLDARFQGELAMVSAGLAAQKHRRFVKSHLPLDGLPYFPEVKYVIVGRDPRDVFVSLCNHYANYTDGVLEKLNDQSGWAGDPFPAFDGDKRALWRNWMTRGWFDWETEGWPYWSNLAHTQSYWEYRELDNFIFVHYADLLSDPRGQIGRLAGLLDIELTSEALDAVVHASSFDVMKAEMKQTADHMMKVAFKGGSDAFMHKGTNGRWRDVLTDEDLALYEQAKERVLSPDCAHWLEHGSLG